MGEGGGMGWGGVGANRHINTGSACKGSVKRKK